jgi:hypothetical protein
MTVVEFRTKKPANFETVAAHVRAAVDMAQGMYRSQFSDFWSLALLNEQSADEDDLASDLLFHLAEWEAEFLEEQNPRNVNRSVA